MNAEIIYFYTILCALTVPVSTKPASVISEKRELPLSASAERAPVPGLPAPCHSFTAWNTPAGFFSGFFFLFSLLLLILLISQEDT